MVTGLAQWRRYDVGRQVLMKQQLQRIVETVNLSKDVYEIASKSLA
jgi:aminopeptidase N